MALLEADSLSVGLHTKDGVLDAITELSFRLERGKTLGLVGESGAGKSMIGRTIAQLLPNGFAVTKGRLSFDGEDLVAMPPARRRALLGRDIAFIPQEPLSALNPVLTIGQQMREHLHHIGGEDGRRWRDRAIAALDDVHLPDPAGLLAKYPHQLSGGMCQRVLIAMAFASRPKLLIADEPTTALDVTIQARIVALIGEMQRRDQSAVLFITHDLRLAAEICDEVMVLYAGRQAEHGPAATLFTEPAHPYTRCLELAVPDIDGPARGLYVLPERMPGLRAIADLTGCRFAARCPLAADDCRAKEPALSEVAPGHRAACFRAGEVSAIRPPEADSVPPAVGDGVLQVADMRKDYVTRRRLIRAPIVFPAVKAASFELRDREFVGIVGESGSGKSTIARMLVGLEQPTAGRMSLLGREVAGNGRDTRAFRQSHMQIVFQDPQSALNPRRRVASIITQALEVAAEPVSAAERADIVARLLAEIGLAPETASRYPSQLSGGQKQRVNIARAICGVPRILVADEIASGLDVSVQAQLIKLLLRLREERGFSMLFISHDLAVVRHLCDRVLVMFKGEIVESGPTDDVFLNPQHDYTRTLVASVPRGASAETPAPERQSAAQ
ncbi:dipeptide ABC transporter ATP-binding protein [Microbaculum sp. FT89]|uniref:ABC transporter ATP-binding protein n=1 Tax=Microbaculum sp. FT89 TaxID=3447298 RepID=UPI003F537131